MLLSQNWHKYDKKCKDVKKSSKLERQYWNSPLSVSSAFELYHESVTQELLIKQLIKRKYSKATV